MSVTLIMGASGTGKSTAIRTLPPDKTVIFSVSKGEGKPLPFKGWKKSYNKENKNFFVVSSAQQLKAMLIKGKQFIEQSKKYVVVDDAQYLMGFEFLRRAREQGFNKFTELAQEFVEIYDLLASYSVHCFMLQHTEDILVDGNRISKAKTLGKLIDDKITWEGLFSIVLMTDILRNDEGVQYMFRTQSDGSNTCKSPMDMFEDLHIPNDLLLVANKIEEYEQ